MGRVAQWLIACNLAAVKSSNLGKPEFFSILILLGFVAVDSLL